MEWSTILWGAVLLMLGITRLIKSGASHIKQTRKSKKTNIEKKITELWVTPTVPAGCDSEDRNVPHSFLIRTSTEFWLPVQT